MKRPWRGEPRRSRGSTSTAGATSRLAGRRRGRVAFTLIEVLVAIVILSTGIVVVLQAFGSSLAALGESRDALRADLLLAEIFAGAALERRAAAAPGRPALDDLDLRFPRFEWDVQAEANPSGFPESADGSNALHHVVVTAQHRYTGRTYQAATLFLVEAEVP